jgi:ergothioneine biosynthesis protein EgtB
MVRDDLLDRYITIRKKSEALCLPLIIEDYLIQGMEDVSPPKWHLAHTTWFFETCILKKDKNYQLFNPFFNYLFNSYYHAINTPFPRPNRGQLSRPSVKETYAYRHYVDEKIIDFITQSDEEYLLSLHPLMELGMNHEQQHLELLLMDIKYNFSLNPQFTAYSNQSPQKDISPTKALQFIQIDQGIANIGAETKDFCFDNERPCHQKIIAEFLIADRLVTNADYLHFINDGGYQNPILWLSDGWDWCLSQKITAPLYWYYHDNAWWEFTLFGLQPLRMNAPVSHVSFYEADAYARWNHARLPTEEEWEYAVKSLGCHSKQGNFLEQNALQPNAPNPNFTHNPYQFFGDLWEWTSSAYLPYPRYKPFEGLIGEYNGKFMNNQRILRGGSCVTPQSHIRVSYRNFFLPEKRWPFCGIRLAKDIE